MIDLGPRSTGPGSRRTNACWRELTTDESPVLLSELRLRLAMPSDMPTAGGYLLCIRELSLLFVSWKRIGTQAGRGDHHVTGARISSPPRCHMSSFSPEHIAVRSPSENCARIKKLGYIVGKHMNLYGEHMEFVSDPFKDGECVAVHVVSGDNPTVRTIDLPVTLLSGWENLFLESEDSPALELPSRTLLPGSA